MEASQTSHLSALYSQNYSQHDGRLSDTGHGVHQVSTAGPSFGIKRQHEKPPSTVTPKKRKYSQDFLASDDENEENWENSDQQPAQNDENDNGLALASQISVNLFDDVENGDDSGNDTSMDPLSQRSETSGIQFNTDGTIRTTRLRLSASQGDTTETNGISKEDIAKKKQKENNRRYAKDSRERKNKKIHDLQEEKKRLDCIIEIYKKCLTIYHKRLTGGDSPLWTVKKVNWSSASDNGQESCQPIKCLLPVLDAAFFEELGNGPYGRIVSADSSVMQHEEPSLRPEQKVSQTPTCSGTSGAFIFDGKTRSRSNSSSYGAEIPSSVSVGKPCSQNNRNEIKFVVKSSEGFDSVVMNDEKRNMLENVTAGDSIPKAVTVPTSEVSNGNSKNVTSHQTTSTVPVFRIIYPNHHQTINKHDYFKRYSTAELLIPQSNGVSKTVGSTSMEVVMSPPLANFNEQSVFPYHGSDPTTARLDSGPVYVVTQSGSREELEKLGVVSLALNVADVDTSDPGDINNLTSTLNVAV